MLNKKRYSCLAAHPGRIDYRTGYSIKKTILIRQLPHPVHPTQRTVLSGCPWNLGIYQTFIRIAR
jgi:hypothetical protein